MKKDLIKFYLPICLKAANFKAAFQASKAVRNLPAGLDEYFYSHYSVNGILSPSEAFKALYIEILQPYTLHLTLKKAPFEVMITGEKKHEFRQMTKWLYSRFWGNDHTLKTYKLVKFVNGYGSHLPAFISEFKSLEPTPDTHGEKVNIKYSTGFLLSFDTDLIYTIELGEVIEKYNIKK